LTYTATDPANGSVTGTGPDVTYTPDPNLFDTDTFDVTVSDGTFSAGVTVNVTITAVNDPPVIAGGVTAVAYTVDERRSGGSAITIPLSLPLSDPDGDLLNPEVTPPEDQHGLIFGVLAGPGRYSTSYRPVDGYVGSDQYGVLVSEGNGGTPTLLIDVSVRNTNDPPTANVETLADSPEDTVRVIPFSDLLANDTPGRNDVAAGNVRNVSAVDEPEGGTVGLVWETVGFTPTPTLATAARPRSTTPFGTGDSRPPRRPRSSRSRTSTTRR